MSLLSVRPSRLRQMAADGQAGAQAALNLLAHPGRLLSLTQVGVTLASLGLGWAGEDTLYRILLATLHPVTTPLSAKFLHAGCLAVSFLVISYFHVVMGEVVPKNLAISKADRLAALVAPPLVVFLRIAIPFVVTIERSASAITRALGLHTAAHGGGHSAEELKLIVSSSRGLGIPHLADIVQGMSIRVPVAKVSLLDITFEAKKEVTVDSLNQAFEKAASATMRGILTTTKEELVSSDFSGNPHSVIVDETLTQAMGSMGKVFGWYDNEWGYSERMKEFLLMV